jgi:hypothetical protein
MDKHVQYIINKTRYLLFIFYKLRCMVSSHTLMIIYHNLSFSIATYGILVWGGAYENVIKSLQKRPLKLTKINDTKIKLLVTDHFKIESLLHHYVKLKNTFQISNRNTRYQSIQLPKTYKSVSCKNSEFIATRLFNTLPYELK